jgi:ketosteroid isomerase-like protein
MPQASTVTTAALNKQLLQAAYAEVAKGNTRYIRGLYTDDVTWFTIGTTTWSKKYAGKQAISYMFARLYALFTGTHTVTAHRFIAEDDLVVVECRGAALTKTGKPYHNAYCMIYRLADGKIKEVIEYCDTALIDAVL